MKNISTLKLRSQQSILLVRHVVAAPFPGARQPTPTTPQHREIRYIHVRPAGYRQHVRTAAQSQCDFSSEAPGTFYAKDPVCHQEKTKT